MATNKNQFKAYEQIVPKAISRVRSDIKTWKQAETTALNPDNPKRYLLNNLFKDVERDALLTSQINNRKLKTMGSAFALLKANGESDKETTKLLASAKWFQEIVSVILDTTYYGYSLIEIDLDSNGIPTVQLIPRTNVIPEKGLVLKDVTEDKGLDYKNAREYGTWLLDFGDATDLGLLNKAVPHVLFKRFAISCWSELCEIFGIPPRVMKTNTQDPKALDRAERMMKDWGAAAWFIIDETEKLEFASPSNTKGEVYKELIHTVNNEISMLISGAIVGQDTKNGGNSKEQSSQELLLALVQADKLLVSQYMNDKVLPALASVGILPSDLIFRFEQVEDIGELWTRTKDILPFKNVDDKWVEDKFGIKVTGDRKSDSQNLSADFFT